MESSSPKSIAIFVGSEGGFSIREAELAKESGALMVGLGKRILRTETASGFVLACLVCFSEL
jgi:16S rRNA (uracil1498-N3)-methyltransferase